MQNASFSLFFQHHRPQSPKVGPYLNISWMVSRLPPAPSSVDVPIRITEEVKASREQVGEEKSLHTLFSCVIKLLAL